MLTGAKTHFHPDADLAETLTQWIGCARVVYNAKCDEDTYLRTFARKYLPVGIFPKPDKSYSQYKSDLTPWLSDCPAQILRNAATIWHRSYQRFFKGLAGRPRRKTRANGNYIWVTRELFDLRWEGVTCVLTLGTKSSPIGEVRVKWNRHRIPKQSPASIWIRKTPYRWYLSFSYDDADLADEVVANEDHLAHLRRFSAAELEAKITPIDRGVAKPLHTDNAVFTLMAREKAKIVERERRLQKYQRRMTRQQKGSNRRRRTQRQISRLHQKTANVRANFWHQATRAIVDNAEVVVIEDLHLKSMTRRAQPRQCEQTGRWLPNRARAKSGLNRALLNVALGEFETLLTYKMAQAGKPLFKVAPHQTSQECADCGHTHPDNRKNQSDFVCTACGHSDNADHNAALVIRKRAIALILHSGTELAGAQKNVLRPGTSANSCKPRRAKARRAAGCLSKKKAAPAAPEARRL